jgi:hypothetical protein
MKFDSKAHMAQELISGKRFTGDSEFVIYYDSKHVNPFRCNSDEMSGIWNSYCLDIWVEDKQHRAHQNLIDSYKEGQAWQYKGATKNTSFWVNSIDDDGDWCEPSWLRSVQYRLHPHNELIQAFNKGAKIEYLTSDGWAETTHPTWNEDTQYRIKPSTKIVYEWMYKPKSSNNWFIAYMLMDENLAKVELAKYEYRKTGRAWEVEE